MIHIGVRHVDGERPLFVTTRRAEDATVHVPEPEEVDQLLLLGGLVALVVHYLGARKGDHTL